MGATDEGLLGPSGNLVLGGHCSPPRALSPRNAISWSSGNRVLGGHCSRPRALSPGIDCLDPRGTECSGAAVRSPERSLPELPSSGPQGTRVLGGHCLQPRAHPSGTQLFWSSGDLSARRPLFAAPSTLSPALGLLGSSGNSGTWGPLFMAPSTLSRHLVFSYLGEIIPKGGRHVALCYTGLGTSGPLVPISPTA